MSGIAAIVRFDGKPVTQGEIEAISAAIDYRGPDGIAHRLAGTAALGHCMLHTTAQSLNETQPLASEDGSAILAFDGYLSHADELRAELLARGASLHTSTDAELVLRAYEEWGHGCPAHIEGEFAFVIWDARRRAVFCARDATGLRPLHYHHDARRLVVASDIAGVVAAGDFALQMNRGMAAEHLANEWHSLDETIWTGIMRLPPACEMRCDGSGLRVTRYWQPSPERRRRVNDADIAQEYREMLADCVRRASRTHRPLACDLSGGLDSSAIFALAHRELAAGRLPATAIDGYSYAFDPGRPEDEFAYAQTVADFVGAETTPVAPFLPDLEWFAECARADCDLPPYPNAAMLVAGGRMLAARGSRVSLNGEGGDNWLIGQPFYYSEHLADRDWPAMARSLRRDAAAFGPRETARRAWRHGLAPLAPMTLRRWRRQHRDREPRGWHGEPYWWLPRDMQEMLRDRRADTYARADGWRRTSVSHGYWRGVLDDPFTIYANEYSARLGARLGFERRSPMLSKPFATFMLSLGSDQRLRGSRTKDLHLRGMDGLLPPEILGRMSKFDCAHPFERLLDKIFTEGVTRMPQRSIDLVNAEAIVSLRQQNDDAMANFRPRHELWTLYSLGTLMEATP